MVRRKIGYPFLCFIYLACLSVTIYSLYIRNLMTELPELYLPNLLKMRLRQYLGRLV